MQVLIILGSVVSCSVAFFAAVALIGLLIYIARQLRLLVLATRASAYQSVLNAIADFETRLGADSELSRIYTLGSQAAGSLNENEVNRFRQIMTNYLDLYEAIFYQYRQGLIEPSLWAGWNRCLRGTLSKPGIAWFWTEKGHMYSKPFRDFVESGECLQ